MRIVLPLTRPALITTAIFTFIWTWNDFFTQLIHLFQPAATAVEVRRPGAEPEAELDRWIG